MEFRQVTKTMDRWMRACVLISLTISLAACFDTDSDSDPADIAAAEAAGLQISFTNPADAAMIQTPDIVISISGTAQSPAGIDKVEWLNDRGGKGNANGKESWVTGNIVLQLGTNNITVKAIDVNGQVTSNTLTVERENTAPSVATETTETELMFSYQANLSNAAPVSSASIQRKMAYFYVSPGSSWTSRGIDSIRIMCCKGQDGPGEGETYTEFVNLDGPPWSQAFDLSGYAIGGTRRIRIEATFTDGSAMSSKVYDFTVASLAGETNTAPLISGTPQPTATAGVQYSFRPQAQDPDGDTMQFSIVKKPSWASFNRSTGRLYGTPTANDVGLHDNIVISVSDGQHSTSLRAFAINVEAFGGGSATLTWSIPTERTDGTRLENLAGFHVYYGQTSRDYANKITVKNPSVSSYLVDNLSQGDWYFVVTAFDKEGLESNPSNEGSKSF
jgi:hypothetical protein